MNNESEIAFLMAQFEAERQAAQWALTGLAQTTKHEFINARMTRMGQIKEQLTELVGEQEASKLVVKAMEQVDKPQSQE